MKPAGQAVVGVFFCLAAFFLATAMSLAQQADDPPPSVQATDPAISEQALSVMLVPLTASELAELAQTWQGHARRELEDLSRLGLALQGAAGAQEDTLRDTYQAQRDSVSESGTKYSLVVDAWAAKGGPADEVDLHKKYIQAATAGALRATDIKTLFAAGWDWLTSREGGGRLVFSILGVLISIWAMLFVARIARRMTSRGLEKVPNLSRLLKSFVVTTVYWLVFATGVVVVLGLFGVNVTPLFAVVGGLSFILGFALQETLGNLASGLMIMILKPFDTGDYIQTAGTSGFVDDMSIVSTRIRTFDNQIILVPNSKIWGDVITNVSASEQRRVDLVFGIAYSDSAAHAIEVLQRLVAAHPLCLNDPPPEIFVGELGDNSVNVFCRPWVKSGDYWTVYWDLTGQAKERFDQEGISIPFPQRDVHLISSPEPTAS